MRRILLPLAFLLVMLIFIGCNNDTDNDPVDILPAFEPVNVFRMSSVADVTNDDGVRIYYMRAPFTDTYSITANEATVTIDDGETIIVRASHAFTVDLEADAVYRVTVETNHDKERFSLIVWAQNNLITLPYENLFTVDPASFDVYGDSDVDPMAPAQIDYQKRQGGTFIFANNPEFLQPEDIGAALIRNEVTGDVHFTIQYANWTGAPIYLGYQLKNESDSDVYITITNIGYVAGGTWFGQRAWYNLYNTHFPLPDDYFTHPERYYADYAYEDYHPRVFQPKTIRLPPGEYFYAMGGTSADAYLNLNIDDTADQPLADRACANGTVLFTVTGGYVTSTFYVYTDYEQVRANPPEQGYVVVRNGLDHSPQYLGIADHAGLVENNMTWTFNDQTRNGFLPVTFTNHFDPNADNITTPFTPFNNTENHVASRNNWITHLNPQNYHAAVGTDMFGLQSVTTDGRTVTIDNNHTNGAGDPANLGNWMIIYHENYTFVNQGSAARTVRLSLMEGGSLAILVRNADGSVRQAAFTASFDRAGTRVNGPFTYDLVVPPNSVEQITLEFVLVACSFGNVDHSVRLGDEDGFPERRRQG
ncbi:MAG: hypothetical protein FWE06_08455 [Oscillospiraceae bacterium]|nr:hypothetical protein [Oscillospiraceae bacterium]